jgi:predicted RNA-binding protein YlxR (DUF448 family)
MGARATSGGRDGETESGPLRLCAVSRTQQPVERLIRFVLGPDGNIVPDLARNLPGRGVWVEATRHGVQAAVRQKAFARSLKQPVSLPEDLPDLVEQLLAKRLAGAVSMANKAGVLVAGFSRVEELIGRGQAAVVIHAADGSLDGKAKLDRKFKALLGSGRAGEATVGELTGPELDLAMGRSNVVHAAATESGASRRILEEAGRLRRYRGAEPVGTDSDTGPA